jgi:GTP diphosphokinase / guanosine-3',5'-bis(diphosphate) 3'-diphosphatase
VNHLQAAMPAEPPPRSAARDTRQFDLEGYRARMEHYLGGAIGENRVFFQALEFSYGLHAGQVRKSGAPYISHPCAVAEILLRELKINDPTLLAAALLHDIVEDVPQIVLTDIEELFGATVAELVDGCTKLTRYHMDRATLKDLTHSKIFLSASRRLGVLVIKLVDRLHNLRTLHYLKQAKRQRIAQETVEVYAPIAAILNIATLKRELYHLALSNLYPRKSKKILNLTRGLRDTPEVLEVEAALKQAFTRLPYGVVVRPRVKGLGTYYDRLKRTLSLFNAENRVDFAIILDSEAVLNCYHALGIVNATFVPVPRTLRDFIANPKNNGYQSIHVRANIKGQSYLVKIRTPEMDQRAIYGILSDWDTQKQLGDEHWQEISELLRSIGEYIGAGPQRKALLRLSQSEDIFAYTPAGDIHYFPRGSIVLDFAYKIHSELGENCQGALVNEAQVGPAHVLRDGDVVEIITSPTPLEIDPALEDLCKTPKARAALNKHLHQRRVRYAQEIGRQILAQEIERHALKPDIMEGEQARLVMEILNVKDLSDLFAHIGQDQLSPHLFLYYFRGATHQPPHQSLKQAESLTLPGEQNQIRLGELDNAIHKFARCCKPYPGQQSLVATLSERGVSIHHADCSELKRYGMSAQDLLCVAWDNEVSWRTPVVFHVSIHRETISSVLPAISRMPARFHLQKLVNRTDSHGQPYVQMTAVLYSLGEAQSLFEQLPSRESLIEWYGCHDWWVGVDP